MKKEIAYSKEFNWWLEHVLYTTEPFTIDNMRDAFVVFPSELQIFIDDTIKRYK